MRTTITLADDVAAAVEKLRHDRAIGLSDAVNELVRAGLATAPRHEPFEQQTHNLGLKIDVTNVAEAIEMLEGPTSG